MGNREYHLLRKNKDWSISIMSDDRPQGTEPVELYATEFGWRCPDCDTENKEEYCVGIVTCEKCRKSFHALKPEVEFEVY
jgi:hypothetical protein